jgi:hypothetical protein
MDLLKCQDYFPNLLFLNSSFYLSIKLLFIKYLIDVGQLMNLLEFDGPAALFVLNPILISIGSLLDPDVLYLPCRALTTQEPRLPAPTAP